MRSEKLHPFSDFGKFIKIILLQVPTNLVITIQIFHLLIFFYIFAETHTWIITTSKLFLFLTKNMRGSDGIVKENVHPRNKFLIYYATDSWEIPYESVHIFINSSKTIKSLKYGLVLDAIEVLCCLSKRVCPFCTVVFFNVPRHAAAAKLTVILWSIVKCTKIAWN